MRSTFFIFNNIAAQINKSDSTNDLNLFWVKYANNIISVRTAVHEC